jgi:uncharacterized ion transporter superfamily protein YfcC
MNDQQNALNINKRAFLSVLLILFSLMILAGILTRWIPAGTFLRDDADLVIEGSFSYLDDQNYPIYRVLLAPFEVLLTSDALPVLMIGLFLIILGGTFSVMDKTGGIHIMIKRLILRYKTKKYTLLRLVILFFMVFGAFFGIFEESLALLPILILLSLSLGWDTLTGLGMCLLAAGFGFASAITNPFSIGIASNLANTPILSGALYRLFIFILMYVLLQAFLVAHAKRIEKDPKKSLTYEMDMTKVKEFDLNQVLPFPNETRIFNSYVTLFLVLLFGIVSTGILELTTDISIPAIPLMAVIFLFGGLLVGFRVTANWRFTYRTFIKGMLGVAPAFILILFAVSVKHIITEGQIMDTILYHLSTMLMDRSTVEGILWIYLLVIVIQFFVGSASAKAFLIMPIIIPLVTLLGISRELAILAFIFGDGYTNVIFPTNGVLLIGLSMASVSYQKWFKFTWRLQVLALLITVILLIIGVYIHY